MSGLLFGQHLVLAPTEPLDSITVESGVCNASRCSRSAGQDAETASPPGRRGVLPGYDAVVWRSQPTRAGCQSAFRNEAPWCSAQRHHIRFLQQGCVGSTLVIGYGQPQPAIMAQVAQRSDGGGPLPPGWSCSHATPQVAALINLGR